MIFLTSALLAGLGIFQWLMIIYGLLILIAMGIQLFWYRKSPIQMVVSHVWKKDMKTKPFLLYYLPDTEITFKLDIDVEVQYADKAIVETKLVDLNIELTSKIVPDLRQVIASELKPNPLYNDELEIKVNEQGLLDNVTASTKDQTVEIITELAAAPKAIADAGNTQQSHRGATQQAATITHIETQRLQKTVTVKTSELASGQEQPLPLNLLITNSKSGNAQRKKYSYVIVPTFELLVPEQVGDTYSLGEKFNGLLSRTQIPIAFTTKLINENNEEEGGADAHSTMVDTSYTYPIELKRKAFVKKDNSLTFDNGFLVQHKEVSPSSYHAFVSIPIEIGKAIMSIPAQLFSFKIQRIKNDTTLATEQLALANADNSLKNVKLANEVTVSKLKSDLQTNSTKEELERVKFELSVKTEMNEIANKNVDLVKEIELARKSIMETKAEIEKLKKEDKGDNPTVEVDK